MSRTRSLRAPAGLALLALPLLLLPACDSGECGSDAGNGVDGSPVYASYFFVRVEGTAPASGEDPGPDIDTVALWRDGNYVWPSAVSLESDMSIYPDYVPRDVDGAGLTLNAFSETDPLSVTSSSTCNLDSSDSIAVGGSGDAGAVWTFPQAIEPGDTLVIVEVGGCEPSKPASPPESEHYLVSVAVSNSPTTTWVPVGSRASDAPLAAISVPTLPLMPLE